MRTRKPQLIAWMILLSLPALGQRINVERDARFGSKINVPVKIEVETLANKYIFYAVNSSYYPYTVHLTINEIQNLTPERVDAQYKVGPGRTRLIELKLQDLARQTRYDYNYTYAIGLKARKIDPDFPYLIPVKKPFSYHYKNEAEQTVFQNHFSLSTGDTVYAMRMGTVVTTPDMFSGKERISDRESLEILHNDQTFLVYENIDPEQVFVKAGNKVLPGTPIGLLRDPAILEVTLYSSTGDGFVNASDIKYYTGKDKVVEFSNELHEVEVRYPEEIITAEFSKRDLKKYQKGQLVP